MRNIKYFTIVLSGNTNKSRIWTMRNIKKVVGVKSVDHISGRIWTMRNIKASCNEFLKSCPSVGFGQ